MSKYRIVNTSVANIYESDSFTSQLVTQALIWERLNICDQKNNWYIVSYFLFNRIFFVKY